MRTHFIMCAFAHVVQPLLPSWIAVGKQLPGVHACCCSQAMCPHQITTQQQQPLNCMLACTHMACIASACSPHCSVRDSVLGRRMCAAAVHMRVLVDFAHLAPHPVLLELLLHELEGHAARLWHEQRHKHPHDD